MKVKKQTIIGLLTVIAVLTVVQMLPEEQDEVIYYFKSYLRAYNITELYKVSEYVIHGVVESSEVDASYFSNLHTRYTIKINEVLKGNQLDSIVVTQDGGLYDGRIYRVKDEPLMKVGEEVVLYLNYSPHFESYKIFGGPQGRFNIKHGKLYHITELDKSIQFVIPALQVNGADATKLRQTLTP
jgi:hypothetical protein